MLHILNGDAMSAIVEKIDGKKMVMRECMIDGPVEADQWLDLIRSRADYFIEKHGITHEGHQEKSVDEIGQLAEVDHHEEVVLWFEQDLFCQTNLWFVCWALYQLNYKGQVSLAISKVGDWRGFGALSGAEMEILFQERRAIAEVDLSAFARLWKAYQASEYTEMEALAKRLNHLVEEIEAVVQAHIDRFPTNGLGRPELIFKELIRLGNDRSFKNLFPLFNEKAGIYGFGDLLAYSIYTKAMNDIETS